MTHAAARHSTDSLKESAVAVKDAVVDLAGEAGHFASDRVSGARESASDMIDAVKTRAGECSENVVSLVRKHPYKSLAIALGVGLAAGLLLRRR